MLNSALLAIVSICFGLGNGVLLHKTTNRYKDNLAFEPTGKYKKRIDDIISSCGINPSTIEVRYGETFGQIAIASKRLIVLDPNLFSIFAEDEECKEAKNAIATFKFPEAVEKHRASVKKLFEKYGTEAAQIFFIKHELGHVNDNFSNKLINSMSSLVTINFFLAWMNKGKLSETWPKHIISSTLTSLILQIPISFCLNKFKFNHEKVADKFAAQHATKEEVVDGGKLLKKLDSVIKKSISKLTFFNKSFAMISHKFFKDHPTGEERNNYILEILNKKEVSFG